MTSNQPTQKITKEFFKTEINDYLVFILGFLLVILSNYSNLNENTSPETTIQSEKVIFNKTFTMQNSGSELVKECL